MVILAVFLIIFGFGVILALWSMKEYGPGRGGGRAEVPQAKKRGKKTERRRRKRVSLKGEFFFLQREKGPR